MKAEMKRLSLSKSINVYPSLIEETVCSVFNITVTELTSKTQERRVVVPRQLCMYLIYYKSEYSQEKTGLRYKRDHATVHHACKTINNLLETNRTFLNRYNLVIEQLNSVTFTDNDIVVKNVDLLGMTNIYTNNFIAS